MIQESVTTLNLPYPGRGERPVRVFVPAHEEGETLPVVYMTDGQNLFDKESSGFGCWYTREAVREERERSGRAAIIVGIHNVDPWRPNELTPAGIGEVQCPEEARPFLRPSGEVFADFVVNTVMPAVEAQFPVKTGRVNTAFCGSSCGGLFCFSIVLSYPEVFCAGGVLSPVFMFFTRENLDRWIRAHLGAKLPFLYLYTGGGDPLEKDIMESERRTFEILQECYPHRLLKEVVRPEQIHHEVAWEPIFRDFLHIFLQHREEY